MAALDEVRKKMNVRNRRFKGNQDFYSLQRMLIDSYAITGHPFYNWAIDGWEEERYMIHYDQEIIGKREWEQNIQVWELETESGYEIVGAVDYQDGYVQFQIHPDYHILDNELFEWAEKHHLAQSSDPLPGGMKPELRTEACGHPDWEKIAETLAHIVKKHSFKNLRTAFSLQGNYVAPRFFSFPQMPVENLSNAISFEAQESVPFSIADSLIDWELFPFDLPQDPPKMEGIFVAANKTIVDTLYNIAFDVGLEPSVV